MDLPGFRDKYADFTFLDMLPGDVSDDDEVVSCCGSFILIAQDKITYNAHIFIEII